MYVFLCLSFGSKHLPQVCNSAIKKKYRNAGNSITFLLYKLHFIYTFKNFLFFFTDYNCTSELDVGGGLKNSVYLQNVISHIWIIQEACSSIKQVINTMKYSTQKYTECYMNSYGNRNKRLWSLWRNWIWKQNGSTFHSFYLYLLSSSISVAFYLFPFPNFWEGLTK